MHEEHILIDAPFKDPKMYEQSCRDDSCESTHEHIHFEPSTKVLKSWRAYIECRKCKRSVIEAIGLSYIQIARFIIGHEKQLVLAGCFSGEERTTFLLLY